VTGLVFLNGQAVDMGFLALSGALGIGVGDTAYFGALNRLGPRLALLLEAVAPIVTAALAWVRLQEELTLTTLLGRGIAIGGITWTLAEQTAASVASVGSQAKLRGVIWGIVAALAQASSSVIARGTLVAGDVDPLESALVRLGAGSALALAIATTLQLFKPSQSDPPLGSLEAPGAKVQPSLSLNAGFRLVLATVLGTYLGIWLQQTALKYTLAGIAQTCLATTPLFILPILYCTGERFSKRAIAGAMVTVLGIIVLVQN
ncbi:MAG: EamA family transporter, partial [Cyanophyceae cyanobacterium]